MNRNTKKNIAGLIILVVLCGSGCLLLTFCGKRLALRDPVGELNGHFSKDFGVRLPAGVKVPNSYWVFLRDPEEAFELQMNAADLATLVDQIESQAGTHRFEVWPKDDVAHCHPLYGIPAWWNSPPMPDAEAITIDIKKPSDVSASAAYGIVWSRKTGHAFVHWGEF